MDITQGKVYHKPEAGMYIGTVIDVAEFPKHPTQWGPTDKLLIVWALLTMTGQPVVGPDGQPVFASAFLTATSNEKSTQPLFRNLYKIVSGVLGGQAPLITSSAQLEQLLLGKSNGLMVTKEANPNKAGEFYSNIVAIMPLTPGSPIPSAPQGFQRVKDRPKTQAGPQGQPVQTYATPQAAAAANVPAPAAVPAAQPPAAAAQPTPEQIAAFLASQKQGNNVGF